MSDNTASTSGGGLGLSGAVFIVFLVLKLTDIEPVSNWSWWWITSPLWIPWVLLIGIGAIVGLVWGIIRLFETEKGRRNRKANEALDRISKINRR